MTQPAFATPTGPALRDLLAPLGEAAYSEERCAELSSLIAEIGSLKRTRNAVVLAHNY